MWKNIDFLYPINNTAKNCSHLHCQRSYGQCWSNKESLRIEHPILWAWFFVISSSLGFVIGIIRAFTRLVVFFVTSMAAIFRIDSTILPKELQTADASLMSYLYALHRQNNPIWEVDADNLKSIRKTKLRKLLSEQGIGGNLHIVC